MAWLPGRTPNFKIRLSQFNYPSIYIYFNLFYIFIIFVDTFLFTIFIFVDTFYLLFINLTGAITPWGAARPPKPPRYAALKALVQQRNDE